MAQEFDRMFLPGLLKDTFEISLGAAFKGMEMMMRPQSTAERMVAEAMTLMSVSESAGDGLAAKVQAVAAVCVEKSATLMGECKTAGQKFTEGS